MVQRFLWVVLGGCRLFQGGPSGGSKYFMVVLCRSEVVLGLDSLAVVLGGPAVVLGCSEVVL